MMTLKEYVQKNNVQVSEGTWDIGFENSENGCLDETEFDLDAGEGVDTLAELFEDFCKENGLNADSVTYVGEA